GHKRRTGVYCRPAICPDWCSSHRGSDQVGKPGPPRPLLTPIGFAFRGAAASHKPSEIDLKDVLHCELHDPGILRFQHHAELGRIQIGIEHWTAVVASRPEAIQYVESLRTEFHALRLTHMEASRQCHIKLPVQRQSQGRAPEISNCAERGCSECRWIQVVGSRSGFLQVHLVRQQQVGSLIADIAKALVCLYGAVFLPRTWGCE